MKSVFHKLQDGNYRKCKRISESEQVLSTYVQDTRCHALKMVEN